MLLGRTRRRGDERGLPHARLAGNERHFLSRARGDPGDGGGERGLFGGAADEVQLGLVAQAARKRQIDPGRRPLPWNGSGPAGHSRPIQPGVLPNYGLLQLRQLRRGLEAELIDQVRADSLVGMERVRLATGTVESDHELMPAPLAERLFGYG
jgi:hypothetical protein